MSHPFVDDMSKRLYSIALNGQFFAQLQTKGRSLASYGLEDLASQVLFVFFVLRFLMEKTLQSDPCTLDDIALYIEETLPEVFHLPLKNNDGADLAALIIDGILRNQGEPIFFAPMGQEGEFSQRLNYITSEMSLTRKNEVFYRMSEDGFRLMLGTLEMEENMQLQFRDLIFNMQMKKKNYDGALDEIRNMFHLLKMREIEISEKTSQIRSSAQSLGSRQYRSFLEENHDLFEEYHRKFIQYQKNIQDEVDEIRSHPALIQAIEEDEEDDAENSAGYEQILEESHNLEVLKRIEQLLDKAIVAQVSMLSALSGFQLEYQQELESQMRYSYTRSYSLRKMVFQPILEQPDLLESLDRFFHPLFFQPVPKQFLIEQALEYRPLRKNEEQDYSDEQVNEADEQLLEAQLQKKQAFLEQENQLVFDLMNQVINAENHQLKLSQWLEDDLFTNANMAREVLSALSTLTRIDLDSLRSEALDLIDDEQEFFNFGLALISFLEKNPQSRTMHTLKAEKTYEKAEVILHEENLETIIRIDDLLISFDETSSSSHEDSEKRADDLSDVHQRTMAEQDQKQQKGESE